MYLPCRCLLTFLLMAFLFDYTLNTQPTVLSLRTVGDARLVVSSEFHYFLPHYLAVFSIRRHHSYCTCVFPFQISSKTSNLPFVTPLQHSSCKHYRIFCVCGSANMFSLSCPNPSCPVLIISLRLPLRSTIISFIHSLSLCYVSRSPHTSSTQILYLSPCRHCCTICQAGDVWSPSVFLIF